MSDIAELGLKIDSSQASASAKALDDLTRAGSRAEQQAKRLEGASTQSSSAVRNAGLNANQAADQMSKLHLATEKTSAATQFAISLFRGLVVALAAGGLYSALQTSIKMLAELGDRMQDTRLSANVLQGLRIGAAEARVSQDELNKALDTFSDVSKKSTNDAKEFYKALSNISPALASAFKGQAGKEGGQDERLRLIADALKQATTETQRYQLAQKALGTDNDRVIALFINGRQAIEEYIETARRYGILVDEAFIQKAQQAEKTLGVLSTVIADKLRMAIVDLIPDLQRMLPYLEKIGGVIVDILTSKMDLRDRPSSVLKRELDEAQTVVRNGMTEIKQLQSDARNVDNPSADWWGFGGTTKAEIEKQIQIREKLVADHVAKVKELQSILDARGGEKPPAEPPTTSGFTPRPSLGNNAFDSQAESIRKQIAVWEADAAAVGKTAGEHARLRVEAQLLEAGLKAGLTPEAVKATDQFKDLTARAEGAANALAKARVNNEIKFGQQTALLSQDDVQIASQLRDLYGNDVPAALASTEAAALRANNAMRDISGQISNGLTTALTDVAMGTKTAGEAFRDFGLMAIRAIEEMIIKLLIVGPLMRSLQGAFGGGGFLSFLGFSDGGYTGRLYGGTTANPFGGGSAGAIYADGGFTGYGGKYQPAGFVHRGEYVFNQEAVNRLGLPFLDRLHRGYAEGGFVSDIVLPSLPAFKTPSPAPTRPLVVNVYPVPGSTMDVTQMPDGSLEIVGRMIDRKIDSYDKNKLPARHKQLTDDPRRAY